MSLSDECFTDSLQLEAYSTSILIIKWCRLLIFIYAPKKKFQIFISVKSAHREVYAFLLSNVHTLGRRFQILNIRPLKQCTYFFLLPLKTNQSDIFQKAWIILSLDMLSTSSGLFCLCSVYVYCTRPSFALDSPRIHLWKLPLILLLKIGSL